ncbi:MAG: hypothetical protein HY331_14175 [Chloroflexi bacterium]|nr:hypothetical protein [Chloroflexota bacterium]
MSSLRVGLGALGLLGLSGLGLYRFRSPWIGRWLGLPPPREGATVEQDVPVPMPDGATLAADHYAPRGRGPFPAILIRTPYGRTGPARPTNDFAYRRFAERGYHVLLQDTRGPFDAQGEDPAVHPRSGGRAGDARLDRGPALVRWHACHVGDELPRLRAVVGSARRRLALPA